MAEASHRFDNAKRRRGGNHDRQRMLTPAYVLEPIRGLLGGIGLDPCTEPDNPTGAKKFYALGAGSCSACTTVLVSFADARVMRCPRDQEDKCDAHARAL